MRSSYGWDVRERFRSTLQLPSADRAVDVVLALGAALVNVAAAVGSDATTAYQYADGGALHVALAAAGGLVLWWRRSHPLTTFAISTALVAVVAALEWQIGAMPFAWLAAAYALGAYASTRRGAIGLAFAGVAGMVLVARQAPYFDSWLAFGTLGQLLLIWLLGCVVHARRTTAENARVRALDAARRAGSAAEEAARAERRRVARDLHDAVTNSLSVVTVQAAAIRQAFPGTIDLPLRTVEATSRAALADLRRMLGALRESLPTTYTGDGPTGIADDLADSVARSTGWRATPATQQRRRNLLARDWPVDVAFGLAVAVINVTGSLVPDDSTTISYGEPVTPVLVVIAAAPGMALVFRRRFALAALVVALAALVTIVALDWQSGNLPGTVLIASFAVAAWAPVRDSVIGGVMVVAVMTVIGTIGGPEFDDPVSPWMFLFAVPWLVGSVVRRRRVAADRALREAEEAEREVSARQARAVADERLRVAEELTDLVAHNLTAVVIQTAAARQHADEAVSLRLVPVEDAARSALDNLRTLLDVLRGDTDPDLAPAPGLDELADLVESHRRDHGPVRLEIDPAIKLEGSSVRLVTYRVVQEALTNIGRHAPGATATVAVRLTDDQVEVIVEDDGRVPVSSATSRLGAGLGLVGMRERVSMHGGNLDTGAVPTGGFRVHAHLERAPQ